MAGLFQVLWGQPDGTLKKAETLTGTDEEPLIIPVADEKDINGIVENICTRPTAVDWDGDGDLDLVVGNFAGGFYLFTGEGQGKFQPKPELIKTGDDEPLKIDGAHSDPFIVDWDRDGDLDLLSGSSEGGVFWAENKADGKGTPKLEPFQTLIKSAQNVEYGKPLSEQDTGRPGLGHAGLGRRRRRGWQIGHSGGRQRDSDLTRRGSQRRRTRREVGRVAKSCSGGLRKGD